MRIFAEMKTCCNRKKYVIYFFFAKITVIVVCNRSQIDGELCVNQSI